MYYLKQEFISVKLTLLMFSFCCTFCVLELLRCIWRRNDLLCCLLAFDDLIIRLIYENLWCKCINTNACALEFLPFIWFIVEVVFCHGSFTPCSHHPAARAVITSLASLSGLCEWSLASCQIVAATPQGGQYKWSLQALLTTGYMHVDETQLQIQFTGVVSMTHENQRTACAF